MDGIEDKENEGKEKGTYNSMHTQKSNINQVVVHLHIYSNEGWERTDRLRSFAHTTLSGVD